MGALGPLRGATILARRSTRDPLDGCQNDWAIMKVVKMELRVRIVVLAPLPGVRLAVQSGRDGLIPPTTNDLEQAVFQFSLLASENGAERPRIAGEVAQGPPKLRFVYVNAGTLAGQFDSCWSRRAKVPVTGISWEHVRALEADPASVLEASVSGRSRDGGPSCGSIPLAVGWHVSKGKE